jgi:aryl-alcohol dehydrogenase-like predicted oxidoreductase
MSAARSAIETVELQPGYAISRVIRGGWQLAGGHGAVDPHAAIGDMAAFYDAGIVAFDCADIYTGVEELIGRFRADFAARRGEAALARLKVHTKFVPDLDMLPRMSRGYVRSVIDRSLQRLGVERLDLVQFHWWDYAIPGCVETALWLAELQQAGKIDLIGGTNFDTPHVEALAAAGVPLATLQVQYSVLDRRPENGLAAACARLGVQLLCYGTVAGGFIGEAWLGKPEPKGALEHRSLVKYKLILEDFGGWGLFQELLALLRAIGQRHGVGLAAVAGRYVLQKPGVAAVIVGARNRRHLAENVALGALRLAPADMADIDTLLARSRGPLGDVYALERDRDGRHGAIMRYNLNKLPA